MRVDAIEQFQNISFLNTVMTLILSDILVRLYRYCIEILHTKVLSHSCRRDVICNELLYTVTSLRREFKS